MYWKLLGLKGDKLHEEMLQVSELMVATILFSTFFKIWFPFFMDLLLYSKSYVMVNKYISFLRKD